jgi:hypothetical protein
MARRDTEKARAAHREWTARSRAKARAAKEAARMAEPITPDLVLSASPDAAPQLAALPPAALPPAWEPFSYETSQPLTPEERAVISEFHAQYMQPPGIVSHAQHAKALREAPPVLQYLRKQLELNSKLVNGELVPDGQEGLQVQRNLAWVEQLVSRAG